MNGAPKPRRPFLTFLKWVFFLILLAVIAFVAIGMFVLDGKFDVSRSLTMKATPEEIHKYVGDLNEWPKWNPFTKQDPTVKTTIEQPTGVGASQKWKGEKSGDGRLTFTASDEQKGIEYDMWFFEDKWTSKGSMLYAKSADETKVTWRMWGQHTDFLGKWLALLTESMCGPEFDKGLLDIKALAETKKAP